MTGRKKTWKMWSRGNTMEEWEMSRKRVIERKR